MRKVSLTLLLCLYACMHSQNRYTSEFKELDPLPDTTALWSECKPIPRQWQADQQVITIAGQRYAIGKVLGEGGKGIVKALENLDSQKHQLVIKELKDNAGSLAAYNDLLLHSTMAILGVPTPKAAIGYFELAGNKRQYVLIKERVHGQTFDSILAKASLQAINFFSPKTSAKNRAIMVMASKIYSRIINAGIYISDMHSRNIMWNDREKTLMLVDGNIEASSLTSKINPKKGFGRAIGILGPIGDRIFYERFYQKNERASEQAIAVARQRLQAYFSSKQKGCAPPSSGQVDLAYDINADTVFH